MTMTFCNKCGKPIIDGQYYELEVKCFLDGKIDGKTRHLDLCHSCYNTIDVTHYKPKVLEEGAKWIRNHIG